MNEEQVKAGKKLKSALLSCVKAGLVVHAFTDVGFYVLPLSVLEADINHESDRNPHKFHSENGMNCSPTNVDFRWSTGAGV